MNNFEQCCDILDTKRELCSQCPYLKDCTQKHEQNLVQALWQDEDTTKKLPRLDKWDSL